MATKRIRNYAAEYARRKARARAKGYTGPRQEYKARKALNFSRTMPTLSFRELPSYAFDAVTGEDMRRIRQDNLNWSQIHSHVDASRFKRNMSNQQARDYWNAYARPYNEYGNSRRSRAKGKRRAIHDYLVKYNYPIIEQGGEEWKSERQAS